MSLPRIPHFFPVRFRRNAKGALEGMGKMGHFFEPATKGYHILRASP
jgi:hypothetical protein